MPSPAQAAATRIGRGCRAKEPHALGQWTRASAACCGSALNYSLRQAFTAMLCVCGNGLAAVSDWDNRSTLSQAIGTIALLSIKRLGQSLYSLSSN